MKWFDQNAKKKTMTNEKMRIFIKRTTKNISNNLLINKTFQNNVVKFVKKFLFEKQIIIQRFMQLKQKIKKSEIDVSRWFLKSISISFNHINYRSLNYMSSHNKSFFYHSKNDWRSLYVKLKKLRFLRTKRIWSSLTSLRKRRRWKWKCLWIKSTILRMFWIWSIHMNRNTSLMMILSLLILRLFFHSIDISSLLRLLMKNLTVIYSMMKNDTSN